MRERHWKAIAMCIVLGFTLMGCPKKERVAPPPSAAPPPPPSVPEEAPPQPPAVLEEPGVIRDITEASRQLQLYDIFFDFDKYNIRSDQLPRAEKVAEILRKNPTWKVLIEGHCDERGTNEYNMSLGWKRANTVKEFLIARGIDAGRIETISYGEERPFVTGCSLRPTVQEREDCWQQNRRAHFVVVSID